MQQTKQRNHSKRITNNLTIVHSKKIVQRQKAGFFVFKEFSAESQDGFRAGEIASVFYSGYGKVALFLILLFFSVFIVPTTAHAAPYGLSISPPLLRVQIKPGKSITQVFTINNLGADDKIFVARIVPFTESDNLGNPVLNLKAQTGWQKYFSLANSYIKLDEPFTIRGGVSEQLVVSLSVPETALLQDIYATLLVSTYTNSTKAEYQGSVVSATIGSNLLISITADVNPSTLLKIENFIPSSGSYFRIGDTYFVDNITPITFTATVKNDGYFVAESKGVFRITKRNDIPVAIDGILPVYVISKNDRKIMNQEGNPFLYIPTLAQIGFYKASLDIKSDNANTSNSIDIIFLPFKAIIGVLFALLILGTIINITKKTKSV